MKAIILAAGRGSRLGKRADGRPKALLQVGDRTLIEHQLEALSSEGIGPVTVVIGHEGDRIREALGDGVDFVVNERYEETNSLYSLWLAREHLCGEVLLLNSDLFFHPDVLKALLAAPASALAYDSVATTGAEQTKVGLQRGRVMDLGKDLPVTGSRGESLGLIKLDAAGTAALRQRTEAIIATGDEQVWVTEAVRSILSEVPVRGVNVAGLPWVEVDFPYDLDRARRAVWPRIRGKERPLQLLRRRMRWASLAGVPVLAGFMAWNLSAEGLPSATDWDTVVPLAGAHVRIGAGGGGQQRWWQLRPGELLEVPAEGGASIRVETRPVLEPGESGAHFVLSLAVDGATLRYGTGRAEPDRGATLRGRQLGTEVQEELVLPPGRHTLGVRFVDGTSSGLLVRVRQAE